MGRKLNTVMNMERILMRKKIIIKIQRKKGPEILIYDMKVTFVSVLLPIIG